MSFEKQGSDGYVSRVPGVRQKTLVYGSRTMMVEFLLARGSTLPFHSHPHEQIGYLVGGAMTLTIGGERHEVRPGDAWCIPGGVEHGAEAHEDTIAVEVFTPVREDYIPARQS
ncbi:MAG TPA: cupin domain-containing protein [Spirochaetia bacterium]|nr:cupin domain-containing protein [Spirochaetia bacterium]